jgi:hypothetical protein
MIVKLFRNLADFRWLIALLLLSLMFVPFRFQTEPLDLNTSLLQKFSILKDTTNQTGLLTHITLYLIIILLASWFHKILIFHRFIPARNFLGLFYSILLLAIWQPLFPGFIHSISAAFFFLAIYNMLSSENSQMPILRVFDAAFLISIAGILNLYLLPFMILPFVALTLFRQSTWNLWAAALTGLLLPHLFLAVIMLAVDDNIVYFSVFSTFFSSLKLSLNNFTEYPLHWICFSPVIFLTVFRMLSSLGDKKIIVRKKIVLFMWTTFLSVIMLFIHNVPITLFLILIFFPLGFYIASSLRFLAVKKLFILLTDLSLPALIIYNLFFR